MLQRDGGSPGCEVFRCVRRAYLYCAHGGTRRGGKLVIVNLQSTPLDGRAALVIHARIDDVMRGVVAGLAVGPVPAFKLRRFLQISHKELSKAPGTRVIQVQGVPFYTILTAVFCCWLCGAWAQFTKYQVAGRMFAALP